MSVQFSEPFITELLRFWLHSPHKPPVTEITSETLIKIFQNYHTSSESALSIKRFLCNLLYSVSSLACEQSLVGLKEIEEEGGREEQDSLFHVRQPSYLGFPNLRGSRFHDAYWEIFLPNFFKTL